MKLKIFDDKREAVEPEKEVYLRLKQLSPGGEVVVYACDEKGVPLACGNLICFYPDGTMRKNSGVNSDLGFQLDRETHVQERTS